MSTIDGSSSPTLAELVARLKQFLRISEDDAALQSDAIAVFGDDSALTSATVQVTDTTVVLVDNVTGTTTLSFAAFTTMTLMVAAIDAIANWNATLLGKADADSDTLIRLPATNALGQANEVTLLHVDDSLLEELITKVWAGIETGLCRDILTTTYNEVYHTRGDRSIILKQPDVTRVLMVGVETEDGLTVEYTGSDTHARVEVTDTSVVLVSRAGGTTTTNTILFTDQATTTDMATAVSAVSGWTGTVKNDRPSGFLVRHGVRDAKDVLVTLEVWDDTDQDYVTEYDEGILTLEHSPRPSWLGQAPGQAFVSYTAGFAAMPGDVELALLESIQLALNLNETDRTLLSERLGDYAYQRASVQESIAVHAAAIAVDKLSKYRRITV